MTLIDHVTNSGALPSLAQTIQFAARRQGLLAHNIANISTPDFQHQDVSPEAFQSALKDAIEDRRSRTGGETGRFEFKGTRQIRLTSQGLRLEPDAPSGHGVLAHDRNNRDLESMMQNLSENMGVYRVATELMRTQAGTLGVAISERV